MNIEKEIEETLKSELGTLFKVWHTKEVLKDIQTGRVFEKGHHVRMAKSYARRVKRIKSK